MNRYILSITTLLCFSLSLPTISSAHVGIPTAPTTACSSIDSPDFKTHVSNQIDGLISSALPFASSSAVFSTRGDSLTPTGATTTPWVRNTDVWTGSLDLSGSAPWTQMYNGYSGRYEHKATLISPRHFITANHWGIEDGSTLAFITSDNQIIYRTVVDTRVATGDISVGVLDSDVPDSVTYYPIIDYSIFSKLVTKYNPKETYDLPIIGLNFNGEIFAMRLDYDTSATSTGFSFYRYTTGTRASYSSIASNGDSGHPLFINVDGRLVLLSSFYNTISGPNYGVAISSINSAIALLGNDGGYTVTTFDPTCFRQYTPNRKPVFTSGSTSSTTRVYEDPSNIIYTYAATDADVGDTISYSLSSLTSISSSTLTLNPADYFSISSSTGQLRRIGTIDNSQTGNSISLTVVATDSVASNTATTSVSTVFSIPYPKVKSVSKSGSSVFVQYDSQLHTSSLPSTSDFTVTINGSPTSISGIQISGDTVRITVAESNLNNASILVSYTPGTSKIKDTGNSHALAFSNISVSNSVFGQIDTSFNTGLGFAVVSTSTPSSKVYFKDIIVDPISGKIYVAGFFNRFNGQVVTPLVRLNTDGSLDTSFNTGSGFSTTTGISLDVPIIQDISLDSSGKIVAVGLFGGYQGQASKNIVRINPDGSLDNTFSVGTGFSTAQAFAATHDSLDRLYIGGNFVQYNGTSVSDIVRLQADGSIDSGFYSGAGSTSGLNEIAIDSSSRILVVGNFSSFHGHTTEGIARLQLDGTVDTSFSASTTLANYISGIQTAKQNAQGKIIVGGGTSAIYTAYPGLILSDDGSIFKYLGDGEEGDYFSSTVIKNDGTIVMGSSPFTKNGSTYGGLVSFSETGTTSSSFPYTNAVLRSSVPIDYKIAINPSETYIYAANHYYSALGGIEFNPTVVRYYATTTIENITPVVVTPTVSSGGGGGGYVATTYVSNTANAANATNVTKPAVLTLTNKDLQIFLNSTSFKVSITGPGSRGNETNVFGPKTRIALSQFQKANNLKVTGMLDAQTKTFILNKINTSGKAVGGVLQSAPICTKKIYLQRYIKFGTNNVASDVRLLEEFLNTFENAQLVVDGIYSRKDMQAVINWQEKYASDILTPLGLKKGTGYVHTQSLNKIKQLVSSSC